MNRHLQQTDSCVLTNTVSVWCLIPYLEKHGSVGTALYVVGTGLSVQGKGSLEEGAVDKLLVGEDRVQHGDGHQD